METVAASEVKNHLSKLLEKVARGQRITITKHGVPVAVLGPYDPEKDVDIQQVIDKLIEFREKHALGELNVREMIKEGRR